LICEPHWPGSFQRLLCQQQPNPLGLQVLQQPGISIDGLPSKSWDEFGKVDTPHMGLVISVCDNADGEVSPYWPGLPATVHWGYPDSSAGERHRSAEV